GRDLIKCRRPDSRHGRSPQGEEIRMARYPAVALALAVAALAFGGGSAAAAPGPDLGPNVIVFDPSMSTSEIQATVTDIASQPVSNEFGTQRYALLFEPGTYGTTADPLNFQVGHYHEVAGSGR